MFKVRNRCFRGNIRDDYNDNGSIDDEMTIMLVMVMMMRR